MLGKEDTTALPNAGEQNPWHPFASTSCSLCSGLPRCFEFSHSPSHHCVSPAATPLSSSSFPTITLRNHLCWESPEPQPHAKTVCITHVTQTLIHSCPGTAVIQTEWSCQKKISPCQVWQVYVSWEHVVVTGTHIVDNTTDFSSFARHWDKVWKLCLKEFPMPPWWIRSIREGTRGARKCVVPPVCNHLRKPFSMRAQWDWAQETDLCIYPTPLSAGDHFSSEQALLCDPDCHAEETPSRFLRVEANITQPQALLFPLKPRAEGLGSQQICLLFIIQPLFASSCCLNTLMLRDCSYTTPSFYFLSDPRLFVARAEWLVLHISCSDLSIGHIPSQLIKEQETEFALW